MQSKFKGFLSNIKSRCKVDQGATEEGAEAYTSYAAQADRPSNDGLRSKWNWYKIVSLRPQIGWGHCWVLGAALAAIVVRFIFLEWKPAHFDEGINGHFVSEMWSLGYYRYDPTNFHGPLYFYFLLLSEVLMGRGLFAFRAITGVISLGVVWLIFRHRDYFGRSAMWAALLVAFSPAFVFYSRYAIHESLFIFAQVAFSYGYFGWLRQRATRNLVWMAFGFFAAVCVKETFFIFFGTWAIAMGCVHLFDKYFPNYKSSLIDDSVGYKNESSGSKVSQRTSLAKGVGGEKFPFKTLFVVVAIGVIASLALFSGFSMNPKGAEDMIRTFTFWTKTGIEASGHDKPFFYWVTLLFRYEPAALVALLFAPFVFLIVGRERRLMLLVAFGSWLAYSLIPYKTPWLILGVLWPLAFVLGYLLESANPAAKLAEGWQGLTKSAATFFQRFRIILRTLVAIAFVFSFVQMIRLNFYHYTDGREPYVYVQSTLEFKQAIDWIEQRRQRYPEDLNMRIAILNRDSWPLPWVLGAFPNLQYGQAEHAHLSNVAVVMIDAKAQSVLEKRLAGKYIVVPFKIREAYDSGFAYFEWQRFNDIIPGAVKVFEGSEGIDVDNDAERIKKDAEWTDEKSDEGADQ